MFRRVTLLALLLGLVLPLAGTAQSAKVLVNTDRKGIALQGYDPVAFFTDGKAVKGDAAISSRHEGATYYFASAEHRTMFDAEPGRYAPAFGGYCAYGVSQGHTASVQIDTWQIVDGRLMLNYNQGVKRRFDADRDKLLAEADHNWPPLVEKEGKAAN